MVNITKTGKGQARVEVNGQTYAARLDMSTRKWVVTTPTGDLFTNSPKLHSIGGLFGQPAPSIANGGRGPARTPRTPRAAQAARPKRGQAFATPKTNARDMKLAVVSSIEDLFVTQLRDKGVTPDARAAYDKFKKLLAVALGPVSSPAMQNEADTALRMAAIQLLKVTF